MKRLFFLLCTVMCIFGITHSCKKDTVPPTPGDKPLLTGVSLNGITVFELAYDSDKRLNRLDYYFNGAFSSYTLFEYDESGLRESRRYDADDHALEYRWVFTLDNFGRVIRSDNYSGPDPEEPNSVSEFEYNTSDQLISQEFRIPGDPAYSLEEYAYGQQGSLITFDRTLHPGGPGEYLRFRAEYTPGDKPLPPEWKNYLFALGVTGSDSYVWDMFSSGSHNTSWNDEGEITGDNEYTASQQQYNSQGYLTSQVITRDDLLDDDPDEVHEFTYSYSQ